jgi:hypothetical protein
VTERESLGGCGKVFISVFKTDRIWMRWILMGQINELVRIYFGGLDRDSS